MANKPSRAISKTSKEILVSYLNKEMDIYRDMCSADLDENYVDGLLTAYGRVMNLVNPNYEPAWLPLDRNTETIK